LCNWEASRLGPAASAAIVLFMACAEPTIRVVETPDNVLSIQDDVVAFQMGGERSSVYEVPLPIDALGPEAQRADSLVLLRYSADGATAVARLARAEAPTYELQGAETYLLYAVPQGRLRATYDVLCTISLEYEYIEREVPGVFDRLCPLILCSPQAGRFDDLVAELPGFERARGGFDFGAQPIGAFGPGLGPGNICDQCTGFVPGNITPTITCGGGSLSAPSACDAILFTDDFEADAVGGPPSTNPQPDPPADMLVLQSASNDIRVISSAPLGSKAVQVDRGSSATGNTLTGIVEGGPHTSGRYRVEFKAYSIVDNTVSGVVISAEGPAGQRAFDIVFSGGNVAFVTGSGGIPAGSYAYGTPQEFVAEIDLDAGTVSLKVDGSPIGSGPFLDSSFSDLNRLVVKQGQAILEALPWELVVDDAQICRL
jgi:hypothetical protein